jgi:hypothetical protein
MHVKAITAWITLHSDKGIERSTIYGIEEDPEESCVMGRIESKEGHVKIST